MFNSAKKITAAIFPEYKQKGKWLYTRLEYQEYNEHDHTYTILNSLHAALEDLVTAVDAWITIAGIVPEGNWELSADFDDSVIVDKEKERARLEYEALKRNSPNCSLFR